MASGPIGSVKSYILSTAIVIGMMSVAGIILGALSIAGVLPMLVGAQYLYSGFSGVLALLGIMGIFSEKGETLPLAIPLLLLSIGLGLVAAFSPFFVSCAVLIAFSTVFTFLSVTAIAIIADTADNRVSPPSITMPTSKESNETTLSPETPSEVRHADNFLLGKVEVADNSLVRGLERSSGCSL